MSDNRSESGAAEAASDDPNGLRLWSISRIDIRSPVSPNAWPVARVELVHPVRGRVTDIGKSPGAFDAAFIAVSHIVGLSPTLLSYRVSSGAIAPDGALTICVEVELELNGHRRSGKSTGADLVECSLKAWLDAAASLPLDETTP